MNNSIVLFFSVLQYGIYLFLVYVTYRRYIRPFLVQERETERMIDVHLQQRSAVMQAVLASFNQQVDYKTTILKKIMHQYQSLRAVIDEYRAKKTKHDRDSVRAYNVQKEKSMHQYAARLVCKDLESVILENVSRDLMDHFKKDGRSSIQHSLSHLKKDAQRELSRRQEKSSL